VPELATANEWGAIDPEQGETLGLQTKGVRVQLHVVQFGVDDWRFGYSVDLTAGAYRGAGCWPSVEIAGEPTREAALRRAVQWVRDFCGEAERQHPDSAAARAGVKQAMTWLDQRVLEAVQMGLFA